MDTNLKLLSELEYSIQIGLNLIGFLIYMQATLIVS
jgi:hypothetical protein